jgi:hypothetical protein
MSATNSHHRSVRTVVSLVLVVTLAVLLGDAGPSPALASAVSPEAPKQTVPTPGAPATDGEGVLPPARSYAPEPRDLGASFSERHPRESRERQSFETTLVGTSKPDGAEADVFQVDVRVDVVASGGDEIGSVFKNRLASLRTKPGTSPYLEPGWAADEVRTSDWSEKGGVVCGIALRHRNAVALVMVHGYERLPTCNTAARLMRTVETRLLDAVRNPTSAEGAPQAAP